MASSSDHAPSTLSTAQILARFEPQEIADILALVTGVRPELSDMGEEELADWLAGTVARPGSLDVAHSLPLEGKLAELLARLDQLLAEGEDSEAPRDLTTVIPDDPEEDTAPRLRDPEQDTAPRVHDTEEATDPGIAPAPEHTDPGVGVLPVSTSRQERPEITDVGVVVHDLSVLEEPDTEATPAQPPSSVEIEVAVPPGPPAPDDGPPPVMRPSRMRLYLLLLVAELLLCTWACAGLFFGGDAPPTPELEAPPAAPAESNDLTATIMAGTPDSELVPVVGGVPAGPLPLGGLDGMSKGQPTGRVHAALPDLLDMRFVELTAGEFTMGARGEGDFGTAHERPAHRVRVLGFWLGVTEVNAAQYYALHDRPVPSSQDHRHAMGMVSWCEALQFANLLSAREGRLPYYAEVETCVANGTVSLTGQTGGYRLPTEAEWEYAARAGRTELPDAPRCLDARHSTAATGNPWGFAGMNGVLWEWTWNAKYAYSAEPRADAVGASGGFEKVIRGGSFASPDSQCSVTARSATLLGDRTEDLGFRLAR